jgi:hypothetical protein
MFFWPYALQQSLSQGQQGLMWTEARAVEGANLARTHCFSNHRSMSMRHIWQAVIDSLASNRSDTIEAWKHLPSTAAGSKMPTKAYCPPEQLKQLRESTARAAEHSASYIAAELREAKQRSERREDRQ